jgi:hypothetical protein
MLSTSLKNTALLGTDRKQLDTQDLSTDIKKRLLSNDTQEQQLLDALTYEYYASINGLLPPQVALDNIPEAITEDKAYISPAMNLLLVDALSEKQHIARPMALEILEYIASHNQLLRPEATLAILDKTFASDNKISPLVNAAIGNRGQKLFELFPEMQIKSKKETNWDDGNTSERIKIFEKWRNSEDGHPELSIQKLRKDWPSEGIRSKLTYLKVIAKTLIDIDGDFLYSVYSTEFENKKITRKTDKSCKKYLISSLTRLNKIPLLTEINQSLTPYLTESKSKKLLGIGIGGKRKIFKPLKKTDAFWDGEHLSTWLGLSESNLDLARFDYDPLYWLSEMIEVLPFSFWCNLLEQNATTVVHYFLTAKQFQVKITDEKESILLPALIKNAEMTRNTELLEALSKSSYQEEESPSLITLFSDHQFETYITTNKLWDDIALVSTRLKAHQSVWSKNFSETYLTELQLAISKGECYPEQNFGALLTGVINPAALPYLKKIHDEAIYKNWFNVWNTGVTQPIIRKINLTIRLRKIQKAEYEHT